MYPNQNHDPDLQHPTQPLNNPPVTPPTPPVDINAALQESEPPTTPSYAHPIKDPSNKKHAPKHLFVGLGIFVVVCIIAVAAMLFVGMLPTVTKKTATSTDTSQQKESVVSVSADTAIAHVSTYFKGNKTAKTPIDLPIKATGKDFYTIIPDIAPLKSVAGEVSPDTAEGLRTAIQSSLTKDGFTETVTKNDEKTGVYAANYTRLETTCQFAVTPPAGTDPNSWFEVRCLDMATYVEYATAQSPLVSLYTPLSATSVQYAFVGKPVLKESKTSGYKTTELQVSTVIDNHTTSTGTYALFYQTPNGVWQYFTDRDAELVDCSLYKSDDQLTAYEGVTCRNSKDGTTATVAPKKRD